jgi:hypothetical protein
LLVVVVVFEPLLCEEQSLVIACKPRASLLRLLLLTVGRESLLSLVESLLTVVAFDKLMHSLLVERAAILNKALAVVD